MSFITWYYAFKLLGVLIALCIGIITYFKWSYSYWKRRNLPFSTPTSWYGTMENPFCTTEMMAIWVKRNYDEFKKKGYRHGGIYNCAAPIYFPIDPDLVKNIMQNDFQYFMDRGEYYNEKADPMSAHLFALEGQKWKNLRPQLTPIFTSGKMKLMFETLVECSKPIKSVIEELTEKKQKIDIKDIVARYTTDLNGSWVYGIDGNSFKNPNSPFRQCGKVLFQYSYFNYLLQSVCAFQPWIGHLFNIRVFPKSSTDFLLKVIQTTVNYRKNNNVKRADILQMLTEIKKTDIYRKQNNGSSLTIEEIAAQCLVFFAGGFETSSTTTTFCLYELTKNQDIQQKVRDEINEVLSKYDNKITYESMSDLKYMTQVIEETMRKYPILPVLTRICRKDYKVPNTNVVIEKGTTVLISCYGLHYDPDYYPNPEKFDPERFSIENKQRRHKFVYIPFGGGPRICIGLRFGMMQIKVCLTVLLKNFIFTLNPNTPNNLTMNKQKFLMDSNETIWLDSKPIDKTH